MKILYYRFQCMYCFIFSGNVSKDSENAPACCNGEKMTALPVYED